MNEASGGAELAPASDAAALFELAALEDRAHQLARQSRAASTWRAYDSDLRHFRAWCDGRGLRRRFAPLVWYGMIPHHGQPG